MADLRGLRRRTARGTVLRGSSELTCSCHATRDDEEPALWVLPSKKAARNTEYGEREDNSMTRMR